MKYFSFCALLITALISCEDSADRKDGFSAKNESPADSLFHIVMEGHDVAMAKMGKLNGYKKVVEQKIDSLSKRAPGKKQMLLDSLKTIRVDLSAAEQAMNEWMERFNVDSAQSKSNAAIQYLEDQKDKVDAVKKKVIDVVAQADSLLKR